VTATPTMGSKANRLITRRRDSLCQISRAKASTRVPSIGDSILVPSLPSPPEPPNSSLWPVSPVYAAKGGGLNASLVATGQHRFMRLTRSQPPAKSHRHRAQNPQATATIRLIWPLPSLP
jgi:hypothetical protein